MIKNKLIFGSDYNIKLYTEKQKPTNIETGLFNQHVLLE